MFRNPHPLLTSSNWRWLTAIAATSLITGCVLLLSIGQASAAGAWCTSPYVQVQDSAAAVGADPTNQYSIEYVSVGEGRNAIPLPAGGVGTNISALSCTGKRLIFQLKVPSMDPTNSGTVRVPPESAWRVNFLVPASKMTPVSPTEAHQDMTVWVIFTSDPRFSTTGIFAYGYFNSGGNGATVSPQSVVTGNVGPDGTFTWAMNIGRTMNFPAAATGNGAWFIDPSVWGTFPITAIQGETDVTIGIVLFTDALTTGDGVYTLQGNISCSNPPLAALAAVPTSGNAPLTVNFDASGSNIPVGGCGTIASYTFNFGDGVQITQSTPTISHTYTTGGVTYAARVSVTSSVGLTSSNIAQQNIQVNTGGPPILVSAGSRATHGIAGDFDVNLNLPPNNPSTNPRGVECRSLAGNYKIVFTFLNNLVTPAPTPTVTTGTFGTVSGTMGPNSNQFTVNVTGVTNQQYVGITLVNAKDTTGALGTEPEVQVGALIGDVNADGGLSNLDVSLVKAKVAAGAAVDSSNFRDDVNADGGFSNLDVSLTKAQVAAGAMLPSTP